MLARLMAVTTVTGGMCNRTTSEGVTVALGRHGIVWRRVGDLSRWRPMAMGQLGCERWAGAGLARDAMEAGWSAHPVEEAAQEARGVEEVTSV